MMRPFTAILVFLLICILGLLGCSSEPEPLDYFPLQEGLSWKYQVSNSSKPEQGLYSVSNLGTTQVNGETAIVRRTNDGRDYYLVTKADGIYRYASRTLFEAYPVVDDPPRMVLPIPFDDLERNWSSKTASYIIRRIAPSTITSVERPTNNYFRMHYRVAASNIAVSVPAGNFDNCLLVEGEAKMTIFADPLTGYEDVVVKTKEWYAPGVGLVKLERTEPLKTRVFEGGSVLFELLEFDG